MVCRRRLPVDDDEHRRRRSRPPSTSMIHVSLRCLLDHPVYIQHCFLNNSHVNATEGLAAGSRFLRKLQRQCRPTAISRDSSQQRDVKAVPSNAAPCCSHPHIACTPYRQSTHPTNPLPILTFVQRDRTSPPTTYLCPEAHLPSICPPSARSCPLAAQHASSSQQPGRMSRRRRGQDIHAQLIMLKRALTTGPSDSCRRPSLTPTPPLRTSASYSYQCAFVCQDAQLRD